MCTSVLERSWKNLATSSQKIVHHAAIFWYISITFWEHCDSKIMQFVGPTKFLVSRKIVWNFSKSKSKSRKNFPVENWESTTGEKNPTPTKKTIVFPVGSEIPLPLDCTPYENVWGGEYGRGEWGSVQEDKNSPFYRFCGAGVRR